MPINCSTSGNCKLKSSIKPLWRRHYQHRNQHKKKTQREYFGEYILNARQCEYQFRLHFFKSHFSIVSFDAVVYAWKIMTCIIRCCGIFSFVCNPAREYNGKDWTMITVIAKRMGAMNRKRMHVQMVYFIVQRHITNGLYNHRNFSALLSFNFQRMFLRFFTLTGIWRVVDVLIRFLVAE